MNQQQQSQPQQMSLSDFLLRQRSLIDAARSDYEANLTQLAQNIEQQNQEIQKLKAEIESLKGNAGASAPQQ